MTKKAIEKTFEKMEKAQAKGDITTYYNESLQVVESRILRTYVSFGYRADVYYNEDLKQEIALNYFQLLQDMYNAEKLHHRKEENKLIDRMSISTNVDRVEYVSRTSNKTGKTYKEKETYTEKIQTFFTDTPPKLLYTVLVKRVMSRLEKYWNFEKSINAEISIETDIQVDYYGGETNTELDILSRLEDTSQRLNIDAVGLLDSVQGSLSNAEYRFLKSWVEEGRKPYDSSRMKKRIQSKLKKKGTHKEIEKLSHAFRQEIYKERVQAEQMRNKLHKLGITQCSNEKQDFKEVAITL